MTFKVTPLMYIILLLGIFFYVKALVNAAKTDQWSWFVVMLLICPTFIFYYLFSYKKINANDVITS